MAKITQWNPFGVSLNIEATTSIVTRTSASQFTVKINVSWETYWSSNQTNYGMKATSGGATAYIPAFDGNNHDGGRGTLTGTYSISGNGAQTKSISVVFENYKTSPASSAIKTITLSVSVPAWTSYMVSYNANGGTGAPSGQTKWKDQTLTLSSTKPTRTGYSFQGWGTSSSDTSVEYAAGAKYTANANVTLYAIWKANTYTVTYNANGGTGAPANQTKTYGVNLKLSTTEPTLTNYNFLGWGKSASATVPVYTPGMAYTTNANITLYAVWELAYVKPVIHSLVVSRCDVTGKEVEDGTSALVKFEWECTYDVSSITIDWVSSTDSGSTTVSASGTSGSVSEIVASDGGLNTELTYTITVTVSDNMDSSSATTPLSGIAYPIDVLAESKGIAFGKPAELEGVADFAYDAKFNKPVYGKVMGLDTLPEIPRNSDLNEYLTTGCWATYRNDDAATLKCGDKTLPFPVAGRFEVSAATGEGIRITEWSYLRQKFIPYSLNYPVVERDVTRSSNNQWTYGDWVATSIRGQKILWDGPPSFMNGDQSYELREKVSKQPNGIVFVFSRYDSTAGVAEDSNLNSFFVPKKLVELLPGSGSAFQMNAVNFSYVCTKYIYISDDRITGNDLNEESGTRNGITYANNSYVLRYVLGV